MITFKSILVSVFALAIMLVGTAVKADMKQMKAYKEAYPDAKVKCIECHTEAMPKKDDGQHEMNEYGKAVMAEAVKETEATKAEAVPTAETYKKVGKVEDLKK